MSYGYENQSRGPRIGMRVVLALVIAVIGIAMYMSRTEVNPVTGEKQHIAMSVDQEKALGLQAAPEMAAKMGGVLDPDTDPQARLVSEVGRRLVEQSDAQKSPYVGNFHFRLLNDPETVNAFALPGGQVFITRGLLEKLDNEAQLAGVLGHEIGHVVGRHAAVQMAKGQLGQMLAMAVGIGASDDRGNGQSAQMAAAMANQMLQLKFSRGDESQADHYGIGYMAEAGYDPRAMLGVMKVLKASEKSGRTPEFLATHPLTDTRLAAIQEELVKLYPNGVPATLTEGRALSHGRSATGSPIEGP